MLWDQCINIIFVAVQEGHWRQTDAPPMQLDGTQIMQQQHERNLTCLLARVEQSKQARVPLQMEKYSHHVVLLDIKLVNSVYLTIRQYYYQHLLDVGQQIWSHPAQGKNIQCITPLPYFFICPE
ncbi:unnamed protein product [Choristocarpus tenellus]